MPEHTETFPAPDPSGAEQRRMLGAIIVSAVSMAALLVLIGASDMRANGVDATVQHIEQTATD